VLKREEHYYHEENSFLDKNDGRLQPLIVQAVDMVLLESNNSTWRRTFVRNVSPLAARVANWAIDSAHRRTSAEVAVDGSQNRTHSDWAMLILRWPVSCIALMVLVS